MVNAFAKPAQKWPIRFLEHFDGFDSLIRPTNFLCVNKFTEKVMNECFRSWELICIADFLLCFDDVNVGVPPSVLNENYCKFATLNTPVHLIWAHSIFEKDFLGRPRTLRDYDTAKKDYKPASEKLNKKEVIERVS